MQSTNQNKRLTLNGLTTPNLIYLLISIAMIIISGYLTNHFYEAHFPTGLTTDSFCSINEFWGCDKASLSPLGSLFNIPTAFFGIIIGILGIFSNIFPSEDNEKTVKTLIYFNALGCIILFAYSLVSLGGLCPMCTVYYILSFLAALLFKKNSDAQFGFALKPLLMFFIITIVPAVAMANHFGKKMANQSNLSQQYITQFFNLATPGDPAVESPYKLEKSTENFADAPLRVSVFSDFQCPFCQIVSDNVHELAKTFKGKINIQYMFYPLDSACNPKIKSSFHQFACKAAYLAACGKEKFPEIHDYIFTKQKELSFENISQWEKDFGLTGCFDNKEIQEDIQKTIIAGDQYNLQSTPTIILNGRKLEGSISNVHMQAIMNELLKRSEKK
jgi:protein-disulfide isomerase/uncharacterized membrane protein